MQCLIRQDPRCVIWCAKRERSCGDSHRRVGLLQLKRVDVNLLICGPNSDESFMLRACESCGNNAFVAH